MIQVSTDYVFDGTAYWIHGKTAILARILYTTINCGEKEVMNHCEQAVVIRTAWLYSIFGDNFVKTMLRFAAMSSPVIWLPKNLRLWRSGTAILPI